MNNTRTTDTQLLIAAIKQINNSYSIINAIKRLEDCHREELQDYSSPNLPETGCGVITTELRLNHIVVQNTMGMDMVSVTATMFDDNLPHPPFQTGECAFFIYTPQHAGAEWARNQFNVNFVEIK